MSHFAFGRIHLDGGRPTQENDAVARIREAGERVGIKVLLGEEILQPIVFDMVASELGGDSSIVFLLVGPPLQDVSDGLISPWFSAAGMASVEAGVQRIAAWIDAVVRLDCVQRVSLFLTEGFETEFKRLVLAAERVGGEIGRRIEAHGTVPSLLIEIRRLRPLD